MAKESKKKEKFDSGKDDISFDDVDWDMDFGEFDDENKDPRKVNIKEFGKAAGQEALNSMSEKIKEGFLRDALPDDFYNNYLEVKDVANFTKDLITEGVEGIKSELANILPDEYNEKFGLRKEHKFKSASVEEMREANLRNTLEEVFKSQREQEGIDTKMTSAKQQSAGLAMGKVNADLLTRLNNEISKMSSFNINVGGAYYRKSLEVQYKSMFIQTDMLKTMNTYYKAMTTQFDSIIKNTALPEHVKITQAERIEGEFKNAIAQKAYSSMFSNNAVVRRFKGNMQRKIKGYTRDIRDALSGVGTARDLIGGMGMNYNDIAGQYAGDYAGSWLGGKIGSKLNPYLRDKLKDNQILNRSANTLKYGVDYLPTAIEEAKRGVNRRRNNMDFKGGVTGWLGSKFYSGVGGLLSMADMPYENTRYGKEKIEDFKGAAIFDKNVYRNITEGIPMYLAGILKHTSELNKKYTIVNNITNFNEEDTLRYNLLDRKLTTEKKYKDSIADNINANKGRGLGFERASKSLIRETRRNLESTGEMGSMDLKNIKVSKAEDMLTEYIKEVNRKGDIDTDFNTMFKNALNEDAHPFIKDYLSKNKDLKKVISAVVKSTTVGDTERAKMYTEDFESEIENTKRNYPIKNIIEMFSILSDLCGTKKNKISNTVAEYISKGFSKYIFATKKPILANTQSLIEAASYIDEVTNEEGANTSINKSIDEAYEIFLFNVSNIIADGDYDMKMIMNTLIGAVNRDLCERLFTDGEGTNQEMERFSNVRDLLGSSFGQNEGLSVENIMEGIVSDDKQSTTINEERIKRFSRIASGENTDEFRDKLFENRITDSVGKARDVVARATRDLASDITTTANNADGGLLSATKDVAEMLFNKAKARLEKGYRAVTNSVKTLDSSIANLTDKSIHKSFTLAAKACSKVSDEIERLIAIETKSFEDRIRQFKMIKETLTSAGEDLTSIDKSIEKAYINHSRNLAIINESSYKMEELAETITNKLETIPPGSTQILIDNIREDLSVKIEEFKGLLKTLNENS